jgi:hypothetical protein
MAENLEKRLEARVWLLNIQNSPEARARPAATAAFLASCTPETYTTAQARSFLRGLPLESEHTESTEERTMNTDPRAARIAQITGATAAFNKSRGYGTKARMEITPAAVSTESPEKLKRLAEIRLNALAMNGQDRSEEAKALRLAFDAHNRMGTLFPQALAQSGFDASTLFKNAR